MTDDRDIALDDTRHAEAANPQTADAGPPSDEPLAATISSHDGPPVPGRASAGPVSGAAFGRYTLEERLGAGAMGVVWRASDPMLGRDVALKLLRRRDDTLTERLVREAQAMARVSHPNVVTVYDVGLAEGNTYIAMELVKGTSLRAWQRGQAKPNPHTVPETVAMYVDAGRGLAAAHAAGIVHRDFKPDNVLVGSDGRARVTDFGLAAAKSGEPGTPTSDVELTSEGSLLGTPAYMAPEQFATENVDSRTDQFNFCVSLYEALYDERPFEGKTFAELSQAVTEGRVRPAPAGSNVSGGLRAIVLRGLSPKPGDRFPTMDHLLGELGRDRARPWRLTAIASAALAAALVLGLGVAWAVHDRVASDIHQSFALTGKALDMAIARSSRLFATVSQVADREQALREVAGHHDQADFGLGTADDDRAELEHLHNTLQSAEWVQIGESGRAIVDYKGRLLYTSYAPGAWNTDMRRLAPVKHALDAGGGDSVTILPYADPSIAPLFGAARPDGLAMLFLHTLSLGGDTSEARAIYLQIEDAKELLDDLRIDDRTLLALVSPDGAQSGDAGMTPALVAAAGTSGAIVELGTGAGAYQVQARTVLGIDGKGVIGRVVMARELDTVLALFTNARLAFSLAALAALGVAFGTALRARRITGAKTA